MFKLARANVNNLFKFMIAVSGLPLEPGYWD